MIDWLISMMELTPQLLFGIGIGMMIGLATRILEWYLT